MKSLYIGAVAIVVSALFASCGGQKAEPIPVESMTTYTDGARAFSLSYPSNWTATPQTGSKLTVFSAAADGDRFISLYSGKSEIPGVGGAKITMTVMETTAKTLQQLASEATVFAQEVYSAPENVTIDGIPALRRSYKFQLNDGMFEGEQYFAIKDSVSATMLEFQAFGDLYSAYKPTFDKMAQSAVWASAPKEIVRRVDTIERQTTDFLPSETTRPTSGAGYSMNVPENFKGKSGKAPKTIESKKFDNGPQDCFLQIDVFDAAKQNNLEKIVEQNKAAYKGASPTATSLGGQKAFVFAYSPGGNLQGKVYFSVKGNRLYRITASWYIPDKDVYVPAFEKAISSFKFE